MNHWQNISLENIQEIIDGVLYIEEWRPIPEFEIYYEGSSFGRIKSLPRMWMTGENLNTPISKGASIMKQTFKNKEDRYLKVDLSVGGERFSKSVHRLIAVTFLENPLNLPEPNHLDSDPENNRILNLKWVTRQENIIYSFSDGNRPGMSGIDNLNAKVNDELVRGIRMQYNSGAISLRALGAKYGLAKTTIRHIIIRKTWHHVI